MRNQGVLREGSVLSTQLGPAGEWPCRAALLLLAVFPFTCPHPWQCQQHSKPCSSRAPGLGMDPSPGECCGQRLECGSPAGRGSRASPSLPSVAAGHLQATPESCGTLEKTHKGKDGVEFSANSLTDPAPCEEPRSLLRVFSPLFLYRVITASKLHTL